MSPRSLLFSSDREASLVLGQVLRAIGLEVEHCPEIFSAVEHLTAHTFDLLIADLDEGAEADFLLKTSHDLSSNREALRIAISSNPAKAGAGVDIVLPKPLALDRTRSALLKSEEFLTRLKGWMPGPPEKPRQEPVVLELDTPVEPARTQTTSQPAPLVPLAETGSARFQSEAAGTRADAALNWRMQRKLENPLEGHLRTPSRRPPPGRASIVRQIILAGVMLLLVYVGIRPARGEALVTSAAVIYAKAVEKANQWLRPAPVVEQASDDDVQEVPEQAYRSLPVTRINVKPSPAIPFQGQVTVGVADPSAGAPMSPASQAAMDIPDSLKHTFNADDGAQPHTERPSRSATPLSDLMQPVVLPENQSQKLLLQRVIPAYPDQALKSGLQGPVTLQAHVSADGKVQDLKLVSGSLILGQAATAAVLQWRYRPYVVDGRPVETETTITVDFRLPQMVSTAVPGH